MSLELWTEKYRPKTMDDYVWADPAMRVRAEEWLADGALPHLLLSGASGLGKTSLALLLLRTLGIPEGDILFINASRERKVEEVQEKISGFISTWALGETGIKYVILDEADALSPMAQKMLRGDMETEADLCRFLLTANYIQKIIPAIRGRSVEVNFTTLDKDDFATRAGEVLVKEGRTFEIDNLLSYVDACYPDLRKCISLMQENSRGGPLLPHRVEQTTTAKDYLIEMVSLFRSGRLLEARNLIVEQAQVEEYPDIYRFFYKNLDLFGRTAWQRDDALLIIRQAVVDQAMAADPEILLSACLVQLTRLAVS